MGSPGEVPGRVEQSGQASASGTVFQAGRDVHYYVPSARSLTGKAWRLPARNPHFTGREELLTRLHLAVNESGTVAVHSLLGLGGVGKSQAAVEYAHRYAADFDIVWWIPAEQPALIPDHLAELGLVLGLVGPTDLVAMAGVVLSALRHRGRWLVVFDNAEDLAALWPYLPSGDGQVLITTRRGGFGAVGAVIDVDVLDRAESIALLHSRIPGVPTDAAEVLAELVGDLPLAIEQAAAYLESTRLPIGNYLDLLRTQTSRMLPRGRVAGRGETLATLWDLSLTALADQNVAAVQLVEILAWLAPEPVPLDLFTTHPEELPEPLATVVTDPVELVDTVGALADWYLIRRIGSEVTIAHRLLQQSLRVHPDRHRKSSLGVVAQRLLRADLPGDIMTAPENWPRWRALLPHVLALHDDLTHNHTTATHDTAWLLGRAATYLQTHGRPDLALPLFERALAIDEAVYGSDHPAVASNLENLGLALRDLGRPAEARPLFERALAIDEAVYGSDHPAVASNLDSLGGALRALGLLVEARPLFERALAIYEAVYGPDHPAVAVRLNNLGLVLRHLGRPGEAQSLYERALVITEAVYGPNHPDVAIRLNNLGGVLRHLGRPGEAQSLYERALVITEAAYGPNHPTVAIRLNNLGGALRALGRPGEAQTLFERALAIDEGVYGPNHPDIATDLNNLGGTLHDLGHPDEARSLYERALAIDEGVYGPNHPDIATDLNNLGGALRSLGRPDEARPLFERALAITEAAYGPSHPTVAIRLNNLAFVLSDLGELNEAEQLYRRSLTIRTNTLGADHPSTLASRENLTSLPKNQQAD
ncbi:FxSxx-COOH system tetratricopeptide repeat protein [Saccharothrix sp. BKS2]